MSGFIIMQREALDHPLLKDGERFRAWFWLIANACWKEARVDVGGRIVELERGQLCYSIRYLADAWGWPRTNVDRFLRRLEADSMLHVTRSKTGTGGGTAPIIITICNYAKYQDIPTKRGTASGTQPGQQRDSSGTNKNKGTREQSSPNGELSPLPPEDLPDWLPQDAWADFVGHRAEIKEPLTLLAAQRAVSTLAKLRAAGNDPVEVIDQSILSRWTGLFPLKTNRSNAHGQYPGDRDEPANSFVRASLDREADRAARRQRAEDHRA